MEVPIRNADQCMTTTSTATLKEAKAMATNPTTESRQTTEDFLANLGVIVAICGVVLTGVTYLHGQLDRKIDVQSAEFRKSNDAQNEELRRIVTDTGDKFERLYNALLTQQAPQ